MLHPKFRTASNSKITKTSHLSSKQINTELSRKLKLVKSQLRLKQSNTKSIVGQTIQSGHKGKTVQFLDSRRQSILNSQYNRRKNNLMTITKQNRKIYERINSQKSNYSSRVLNKSYDSICSVSSRISRKSSGSRQTGGNRSSRMGANKTVGKSKAKKQQILTVHNINSIKTQQLQNFNRIFQRNNLPPKPPLKLQPHKNNQNQINEVNEVNEVNEEYENFPQNNKNKSMKNIISKYQFTPDRMKTNVAYNNYQANVKIKNSKQENGLPLIHQMTPQRDSKLCQIIDCLGYRYRY